MTLSSDAERGAFFSLPKRPLELDIHRNKWLLGVILAFFLMTWMVAFAQGVPFVPFLLTYIERVFRSLILLLSIALLWLCVQALIQSTRRPVVETIVASCRRLLRSRFLERYAFAALVLSIFMAAFLYNKMRIPEVAGFQWDQAFAKMDYWIFGDHPWKLLQPVIGYPIVTLVLDLLYSIWVPLVFLFWSGLFASRRIDPIVCRRFWISTVASWLLLGLGMATVLSSAGPTYFDDIFPYAASPYAELEKYLNQTANTFTLTSSMAKDYLWAIYAGNLDEPGGISAMPSMHNAQCALFVAAAYSIDKRIGHLMLAYAVLIFLGSIHLGWHYAVDGVVGIVGALLIWIVSGIVVGRRTPVSEFLPGQ